MATGACWVAMVGAVACEAIMAPSVNAQTSREAAKRLFSIRVSKFMVVLHRVRNEVFEG
ncbi:hypothetical protein DYGSA30_40420 [Dyella sp. GSA-30]|nr:hypothetical protein DYGSA30_40420 [Dyella sp. GSA-30]